ncbi:terminase small subunit [Dellaglioa sp. BT-FLS60]
MRLTEKQRRFADEYIKSGNATQSAINAGYSKKTAQQTGSENLLKPVIKKYVGERMKQLASERIMSATEAVELLSSIARGEEKETVIISSPLGAEEFTKEADLKTRIVAAKEILKRYPLNDKSSLEVEQIRKVKAEADIKEAEVAAINNTDNDGITIEINQTDRRDLSDENKD